MLKHLDFTNLQSGPFDLFEMTRGWQPLLRRLPLVRDGRIVTLARRNITKSIRDPTNLVLISRHQWAVIECIRHAQGLYRHDPHIRTVLEQDMNVRAKNMSSSSSSTNYDGMSNQPHVLTVVSSEKAGRHVLLESSKEVAPGEILYTAIPYSVVPYDFANHAACFHCGKDFLSHSYSTTSSSSSAFSSVRDLSLQCPLCQVSSLSYCSVSCRHTYQARHEQECPWILELTRRSSDVPIHPRRLPVDETNEQHKQPSDDTDHTKNRMAPFKALLVLRAALQAKTQPIEFQSLLQLESHAMLQEQRYPEYVAKAKQLSQWMVDDILTIKDIQAIQQQATATVKSNIVSTPINDTNETNDTTIAIQCLIHLFLAISVNAIGLGPYAVGLFPGIPSMFNHSCLENVTHSWDPPSQADDSMDDFHSVLNFRAVEPITQGQECCISYVDQLHLPTSERTQPLQDFKFFSCSCARCQSPTEQGRIDAMIEWKECTQQQLSRYSHDTKPLSSLSSSSLSSTEDVVTALALLRRQCEVATILYPPYFVSKGLVMEELAHAILQVFEEKSSTLEQHTIELLLVEAKEWLEQAKQQYTICRGERSALVTRVQQVLESLPLPTRLDPTNRTEMDELDSECIATIGKDEESLLLLSSSSSSSSSKVERVVDDNEDLVFMKGWHRLLLEVKTYEVLSEDDFESLANHIQATMSDTTVVQWADGYRTYDIGYGIRSLILSCEVNMSLQSKEEIANLIEETFEDEIQHVDWISNS